MIIPSFARPITALLVLLLAGPVPGLAQARDDDRDGLDDSLEQALLERFRPTLVLSAGECAGLPTRFAPDAIDPLALADDGTLYGHVSPRTIAPGDVAEVEIQYFHLWRRDCGRPSHRLDVERVSALVWAPSVAAPPDTWEARQWYAAAHEGTVCDASTGARAEALRATRGGPYVYVSRGKHASYLERGHCKWGCGSDICDPGPPAPRGAIVNLGEREAPLNGAAWVMSRAWGLADKMGADFEPARRSAIDRAHSTDILALRIRLRPLQSPILGGDTGLDALVHAGEAALAALEATTGATATALDATAEAVAGTGQAVTHALGRTLRGITGFFKGRPRE